MNTSCNWVSLGQFSSCDVHKAYATHRNVLFITVTSSHVLDGAASATDGTRGTQSRSAEHRIPRPNCTTSESEQHHAAYCVLIKQQTAFVVLHNTYSLHRFAVYRVGQKSKLLILRENVNKTEKTGRMWTNTNFYRENGALSYILREVFYVTIVLCLNILCPLGKHELAYVNMTS